MSRVVTSGRYPTLGEVRDYYRREDFLDFLSRTCAIRRVVMVIPEQRRWEPDWAQQRVRGDTPADLRDFVTERINARFASVGDDQRLPFYPSFHQSLERWSPGQVDSAPKAGVDGTAEADLPTWRESFRDVFTLLAVLREEGVPFHVKFSGCRSLHVMVPYGSDRLRAAAFGDSQAHGVKILRMPHSLNEDTGMVSLPLSWEDSLTFRPWQANLHLVSFNDEWLREPTPEERQRIDSFVSGLKKRQRTPRRPVSDLATRLDPMPFGNSPCFAAPPEPIGASKLREAHVLRRFMISAAL